MMKSGLKIDFWKVLDLLRSHFLFCFDLLSRQVLLLRKTGRVHAQQLEKLNRVGKKEKHLELEATSLLCSLSVSFG